MGLHFFLCGAAHTLCSCYGLGTAFLGTDNLEQTYARQSVLFNIIIAKKSKKTTSQATDIYRKRVRSLKAKPPIRTAAAMLASDIVVAAFHPNSFTRMAIVDRHGM